jgi:hypothetical protein
MTRRLPVISATVEEARPAVPDGIFLVRRQSGISVVTPVTYSRVINAPACSHAVEAQNVRPSLH